VQDQARTELPHRPLMNFPTAWSAAGLAARLRGQGRASAGLSRHLDRGRLPRPLDPYVDPYRSCLMGVMRRFLVRSERG
jgi:hypothetical protein